LEESAEELRGQQKPPAKVQIWCGGGVSEAGCRTSLGWTWNVRIFFWTQKCPWGLSALQLD